MEKIDTNLTVVALIINPQNKEVLIEKRADNSNFMPGEELFLGGKVEPLEEDTPEATLSRELREELGIVPINFTPLVSEIYGEAGRKLILYAVHSWQGVLPGKVLDVGNPVYWKVIYELGNSRLQSVRQIAAVLLDYLQNQNDTY